MSENSTKPSAVIPPALLARMDGLLSYGFTVTRRDYEVTTCVVGGGDGSKHVSGTSWKICGVTVHTLDAARAEVRTVIGNEREWADRSAEREVAAARRRRNAEAKERDLRTAESFRARAAALDEVLAAFDTLWPEGWRGEP